MSTTELRKKIIQIVERADEQYLKQLEAFMHLKNDDLPLSDEHKELLDERLAKHRTEPEAGRSWKELKAELDTKYGL